MDGEGLFTQVIKTIGADLPHTGAHDRILARVRLRIEMPIARRRRRY
jgi:hypothetical protein